MSTSNILCDEKSTNQNECVIMHLVFSMRANDGNQMINYQGPK